MRLVIDGQRLAANRTGVGRCLESLLKDWSGSGWPLEETLLVVRDPEGLNRVPSSSGLRTLVVGRNWPGLIWENLGLGRVLRTGDLLFAPANLVPLTWRGPTVAVLYDTLPWSVPTSFPWHVRWRFGWRYRLAARRATRVVVPSQSTARDVARIHRTPASRVEVVYPGPEPCFRPLLQGSPVVSRARLSVGLRDEPFFLFVGKRSKRRNVPALLEAFARHLTRFPEHRLVFVGPDGDAGLSLDSRGVLKGGHVDEATLHGLYASALGLIYPSDHEGFGLPVVEAQACGCPVITLANSALVESGGNAAYYLASASVEEMERALEALSIDHILRVSLEIRGLENASRFRCEDFGEGVKQAIQAVAREFEKLARPDVCDVLQVREGESRTGRYPSEIA